MDAKKDDSTCSTQKTLSSSHDPGWNDPPKWAYTPKETNNTPAKRLLNKRVAFPLNSSSAPSSAAQNPVPDINTLPPLSGHATLTTAPHAPLAAPSIAEKSQIAKDIDKEEALKSSLKNLKIAVDKNFDTEIKAEEIQKRLDIMKSSWVSDKLNPDVWDKVLRISEALEEGDATRADKLHVSLMMDHASLCSSWISGVRQIIQKVKEKNSSAETETETLPYMLPNSTAT